MLRHFKTFLFFSFFFLVGGGWVIAQSSSEHRIQFQKGHSSAMVKGQIPCDQTVTYLVGAKAGQKMSIHLSGRGAAYRLSTPKGGNLQGGKAVNRSTDELTQNGDYKIAVECWKQKVSDYELEVVIQ